MIPVSYTHLDVYKRQLGKGGIIRLVLGQRADLDRIIIDEGGLDQLVLNTQQKEI